MRSVLVVVSAIATLVFLVLSLTQPLNYSDGVIICIAAFLVACRGKV